MKYYFTYRLSFQVSNKLLKENSSTENLKTFHKLKHPRGLFHRRADTNQTNECVDTSVHRGQIYKGLCIRRVRDSIPAAKNTLSKN